MKQTINLSGILIFLITGHISLAQTNQEKAREKSNKAIELEDGGKVDEAIKLLEEAQKLDPDNYTYPYELGYAYYQKADYKKSIKYLETTMKYKDIQDEVYQLLGNSYDNIGKGDKAIETYKEGLKKFPNSGSLYLEMGIMQMGKKEYSKALDYYEQGIKVDPKFPSNYYWAARIYCSSTEEVWGMIYGELFINMERGTKRTGEISKELFDTYKKEIKFTSDTSFSVSFSKNATIDINALKDPSKMILPFGVGVYEPTLMLSMLDAKKIDLSTLNTIRSNFVDNYFKSEHDKKYPNILFSYQKQLKDAGHMEAYNYWLLSMGDQEEFGKWQTNNKDKWDAFTKWFKDNKIQIDETHRFYSRQY
jgi:tetratricopeptide (TPR) repeat protein